MSRELLILVCVNLCSCRCSSKPQLPLFVLDCWDLLALAKVPYTAPRASTNARISNFPNSLSAIWYLEGSHTLCLNPQLSGSTREVKAYKLLNVQGTDFGGYARDTESNDIAIIHTPGLLGPEV